MSSLNEWKSKGRTALQDFVRRLPPIREITSKTVIYGATAAVLLPLLQMGQGPATTILWQFLVNTGMAVGQNLVAFWIQRFYEARNDENRLAQLIEQQARDNAELRAAVGSIEKVFGLQEIIVQADLSEPAKQWLLGVLRAELQTITVARSVPWDRSSYLRSLVRNERFKQWDESHYIKLRGKMVGHSLSDNEDEDLQQLITSLAYPGCLIVVEGEPGAGKTTALERLVFHLAQEELNSQAPSEHSSLPVLIHMDRYVGRDLCHLFAAALNPAVQGMLSDSEAEALMQSLDLFVLIDGLDQLHDGRWEYGYAALRNYLERSPHHRRVLTWRGEDPEIAAEFETFDAQRIRVQPLEEGQIREYLKQRLGANLGGALDAELSADLVEVVKNPLVLSLLTEVVKKVPALAETPSNRGALLEHIIHRAIERNRRYMVQKDRNIPASSILARMLAYLAWAMRHEEPPGRDERKTCRVLKEWFERYEFEYDPHVALGWLLDTPWLHREGNLIVFRHPYIMDTLTAMEWKTRFMEEGGETALGYVASVMPRPEWQEVVILLAGMLDCEMASLLTESLMDQNLMDLAARCIVAGTNVKRTTLARVIRALLAPHTEGEQR